MERYKQYRKRDGKKDYFMTPNDVFSLGLSVGEFAVYSLLLRYEDRETYECYPSYKTIGKALNLSTNSVRKYVDGLREKGLIKTEPTHVTTRAGQVRNGTLLYKIQPIDDAIHQFYQRQMEQNQVNVSMEKARKKIQGC